MNFDKKILKTYFIAGTPDIPQGETLKAVVQQALDAGITAFQYREKGQNALTGQAMIAMAKDLQKMCQAHHVPFIVDNDIALAKTLQADGVHVGQTDTPADQVAAQIGYQMFLGLSCHTKAQIQAANQIPAVSYIGTGAIYPSPSKAQAPVIGVVGLRELVQVSQKPIVAIGGINEDNINQLPATGVAGASVISMIARSHDIAHTVQVMNAVTYQA